MGDHAASLTYGEEGVMHGFNSIMLKDENGEPAPVYSVASGLDYPSSGPEHAFLRDIGRVKYDVVKDEETIDASLNCPEWKGSFRLSKALMPCVRDEARQNDGQRLDPESNPLGQGVIRIWTLSSRSMGSDKKKYIQYVPKENGS